MLPDNIKTCLEKLYDIDTGINIHDYRRPLCQDEFTVFNPW